ncbi:MAG: phospholipid carrier-dependent glycosyltransferase, partial [Caldilineaceae bacterium]|nr:phospholipid carrier-dependent glycosyltransferase [Caldilineaceae bacterium]
MKNADRPSWIVPIVVVYVVLATMYSIVVPLFEAPDEIWHYEYIRWLAEGHGLPEPADVGVAPWAQEGSQPPLYYLAGAALTAAIPTANAAAVIRYNPHAAVGDGEAFGNKNMLLHGKADAWPWRGVALAAHIARFLSVLLGAVTVTFTYYTARLALPGWPAAAPLAAMLVAFNPQFLFVSGVVSNDNLVTAVGTAGVWLCLHIANRREPPSVVWVILLGVLAGAAALSKLSGLLLIALALLALFLAAWRRQAWRFLIWSSLVVLGAAILVAGWWYLRNWMLFGDPLALSVMFAVLPPRTVNAGPAELLALAPGIWRSFWAVFGWFNVLASSWVYWVYSLLVVAGLAGWLVGWLGRTAETRRAVRLLSLLLLIVWIMAVVASVVRWAQINYAQGRLLFLVAAPLMTVVAGGLVAIWPQRWRSLVAPLAGVCLAFLAAMAPFLWILPAYAPPEPLPAGTRVPNPTAIRFGDHIQLVGYALARDEVLPGDTLDLTLYWATDAPLDTDYSVFVHATDEVEILQAQRDSQPGLGNLPMREWPPGAIIADRHRLAVPATTHAPARLRIDVGLYDYATGERLLAEGSDRVTLGYVQVPPRPDGSGLPNATRIDFDGKLALAGYELDRRTLAPGERLTVTLWWEVLAPMQRDYVVFTHLVLPPDAVWAQQDQMPQGG